MRHKLTRGRSVQQQLQLVITATVEDGVVLGVKVGGPVGNRHLCYGMMEMAKDAIRDFKPPEVQIADGETARLLGVH